jgi:hypothetical protein
MWACGGRNTSVVVGASKDIVRSGRGLRRSVLIVALLLAVGWSVRAHGEDPFWGMSRPDDRYFEPTIGVGPQSIIQVGNFRLATYDRVGNELWRARLHRDLDTEFSDDYFWKYPDGANLPDEGAGDVRVLYDHFASRFIVMGMRFEPEHYPNRALYLAVSKDGNPESSGSADWDKFYILVPARSWTSATPSRFSSDLRGNMTPCTTIRFCTLGATAAL